jgi:hypothetical protein
LQHKISSDRKYEVKSYPFHFQSIKPIPGYFEGDIAGIVLVPVQVSRSRGRTASANPLHKWPNKKVPYVISDQFNVFDRNTEIDIS